MRNRPIILVLCVFTICGCNSNNEITQYNKAISKLSEAINYEMEDKGIPGLGIVVVRNQEAVWSENFGYEDPETDKLADNNTVYRVGSVSKLFTDIGIMQLVEKGDIDLDVPITTYLPEFQPHNPFDTPITLRQLMSHRSGLIREPRVGHYFDDKNPTLQETVMSLNQSTLVYAPESRTKYSNGGIAAVGYVLEKTQGQPFTTYLQESVLDPMGLKNSSFEPTDFVREHLSYGEMWSYDGREFPAPTFELGMSPAGSMYATMDDLGEFMSVLFNEGQTESGQIIQGQTLKEMWEPQFEDKGSYGIGFNLSTRQGYKTVGHGGAIYGFSTELTAVPEKKIGAAVVSSKDATGSVSSRLVEYAIDLMIALDDNLPLPEYGFTAAINREEVDQYIGNYRTPDKRMVSIEWVNRELVLKISSVELRLKKTAESNALIMDGPLAYGDTLIFDQDGFQLSGTRFSRGDEVQLIADSDLEQYIGEYGWDFNVLFIYIESGKLNTLIEWVFKYGLEEVEKDVFAFPDRGLYHGEKLKFNRDDQDNIVSVELVNSVVFPRRETGDASVTFRIVPVRDVDKVREEALKASPPAENDKLEADLIEPSELDPTIKLDIRYASTNNFMSTTFYTQARAFLQRPAAEALVEANRKFSEHGLGILIHDAYRPWYVTKMFWDATPDDKKLFVANPANGSRHNRGCAVDMSLYDLETGEVIEMVAGYDEMSERSYPNYAGGTDRQRMYRRLLRETMESVGFTIYGFEWWHFDYKTWNDYPILNLRFEDL